MEDIEGNEIKTCQEIGTRKYHLLINNLYFVDFKETEKRTTTGGYCREGFQSLGTIYLSDIIVVSDKKENAYIIDGKINLKSFVTKLLSGGYKFYNIEIVEIEEEN